MRRLLLVAIAASMLLYSAAAEAARLPVYREPPSYKGRTKAPPTKPAPLPPAPPAITLSETGEHPDVLVDEAGTAHIVWTEGHGDGASTAEYCRLKRGATACDQRATLVWNKDYGAGDGPEFNTDYTGPRIVRVGNQLAVFSKRYPTSSQKPNGGSSHTVIEWVSSDGGNTWTDNGQIVGTRDLGQMQVFGVDNPSVLNVSYDAFCKAPGPSGWCIEEYRSGQFTSTDGNLSTASNQNYNGGVALDETGRPVAIATDAGGNAFVRRWSGQGSITDGTSWSPASTFVGDAPSLTGGPSGAWLMSETTFNTGPFSVRRLNVNGDGTIAPGPATDVSANQSDIFAELFEDPAGGLHAAWEQRAGDKPGVKLRSSTATGFGPTLHIYDGASAGQISVGATDDGGGFSAFARDAGKTDGGVVAVGFGNQAATGKPGLGDIPGGAGTNTNVSCQKVDFGRFAMRTPEGCFNEGSGRFANLVVSTAEVTINGLRIVPDPGAKLIIDPRALRIDTEGAAQVIASGSGASVVLFHGPLHTDLSRVTVGTNLFEFPSQAFKANVLGFPVAGDIPVKLTADGVLIPVDITLPPEFGGFTGHANLIANAGGLQLDSLKIDAGPIYLGALTLKTVHIEWTSGGTWSGHAELTVPAAGTITADVSFVDGEFNGATFNLPLNPAQPIGPFVYLTQINGGFRLKPSVRIDAGATVGAGAPLGETYPVDVNGTFSMIFPKSSPASFQMHGQAHIFSFGFADLLLEFQTDGYAQFRGETNLDLEAVRVGGHAEGWVDATKGQFGAEIKGNVEICWVVDCTGPGVAAAISNAGMIVCGEIVDITGGLEMSWDDIDSPETLAALSGNPIALTAFLVDHMRTPCNSNKYYSPPPRPFASAHSSATGGQIVSIPRGLPTATFVAVGQSQAPSITVTGPRGISVASGQSSKDGTVLVPRGVPASYAVIKNPPAGDYTIAPNADSVDIVRVIASNGYRQANVKASLRGHAISYRIANSGNGQQVVFQERGAVGTRTLGVVTNSTGRLRFKPAAGRGGKRTVVALIQKDGFTLKTARIGTFTAPSPPKPGAVGRLRATHKAHKLSINWRPARSAASYVVRIGGSKGTRITRTLGKKGRAVTLAAVRRDERFTVKVQAIGKDLRPGPIKSAKTR